MRFLKILLLALSLTCLAACTQDTTKSGQTSLQVEHSSYSAVTDGTGQAAIAFEIPEGTASFQVSADAAEGLIRVASLTDPEGREIRRNSSEMTRSSDPFTFGPNSLNYPFVEGGVLPGIYTVLYEVVESKKREPLAGQYIDLSVAVKPDDDLRNGTIAVNLILVGPVGYSPDTIDALEKALDIWRLMASRAGILIDDKWYNFDGGDLIPDPRSGDPFYGGITKAVRRGAVNLVFASRVGGLSGSGENKFGLPGAIPGPLGPSPKGVIAISVLALTGNDGKFDYYETGSTRVHNSETRLAAEEMARLTARYLGLENIVTISGSRVVANDSLNDTAACLTLTACRNEAGVRNNMMFPFPLLKYSSPYDDPKEPSREFFPRDVLSEKQRLVLNRSVFID